MTSGKMKKIKKHKIKAFILLFLFFTTPAHALELIELLHLFSQEKQSTVDFNDEKYASFLDEPIKSSGYLKFIAPNKLQKIILKPEKISHNIDANELEIISPDETHIINLDDYPELSIILRATISVLAGNITALKEDFKIIFEHKDSGWTLLLSPHDSYISGYVESIKMSGNKNKISKIIVTEPNHDQSITYLSNHR